MAQHQHHTSSHPTRRDLSLEIYKPDSHANGGAVILLHGGAWRFGHRKDMEGYALALAAQGFVAIAAEYRLLGEALWPAQLDDVKSAIDWVKDNADQLGIRTDAIALEGFSAGGHLAMLAAAQSSSVAAVISFFAPPSLRPVPNAPNFARDLYGREPTEAELDQISPITQITASFPPTFLITGANDKLVPWQAALSLFQTVQGAGVEAELHIYGGQIHEFSSLPSLLGQTQAEVGLFLRRIMIDPEFYIQENLELNMFAKGLPPAP